MSSHGSPRENVGRWSSGRFRLLVCLMVTFLVGLQVLVANPYYYKMVGGNFDIFNIMEVQSSEQTPSQPGVTDPSDKTTPQQHHHLDLTTADNKSIDFVVFDTPNKEADLLNKAVRFVESILGKFFHQAEDM